MPLMTTPLTWTSTRVPDLRDVRTVNPTLTLLAPGLALATYERDREIWYALLRGDQFEELGRLLGDGDRDAGASIIRDGNVLRGLISDSIAENGGGDGSRLHLLRAELPPELQPAPDPRDAQIAALTAQLAELQATLAAQAAEIQRVAEVNLRRYDDQADVNHRVAQRLGLPH